MNQTAVIFGATGLIGKELTFELLENPEYEKVITVTRRKLPLSHQKLEQLLITGYTELENLKGKLNAHTFFCCIGTTIKTAGSQEAFRKVDFDIPAHVAMLANELSVENLVVISSIGANASSGTFYLRTKGEMEQKVKETYKGNLKIVRPSLLMGNREEFRFGEKFSIYVFKVLNHIMFGPLKKYRGIYAWDVAKAMIKSIQLPREKVFIESDELQNLAGKSLNKINPHEVIK